MATWDYSLLISGASFKPSTLAIAFTSFHDSGSVATSGRYKGQPYPYGFARITITNREGEVCGLEQLCDLAQSIKGQLELAGAERLEIAIARRYVAQCNEELSPEVLKKIVALDCPLTYTAYQSEDDEIA